MVRHLMAVGRTELHRVRGTSDARRWGDRSSLLESWDERTQALAELVPPGSTVLELGAGRMQLRRHLPEGCAYTPSDLVDRGPGTVVMDLNGPELPAVPMHDVAVAGGVLEYVHDLPRLTRWLAATSRTVIVSYAVTDQRSQASVLARRRHGWVNDYSAAELMELFRRAGLETEMRKVWQQQELYRFSRR